VQAEQVMKVTLFRTTNIDWKGIVSLRYRSSVLAGWIHGVFNTQRLGMWALLFPNVDPWLGGFSGIVGISIWLILGAWEGRHLKE
jgi:hypothetical protein